MAPARLVGIRDGDPLSGRNWVLHMNPRHPFKPRCHPPGNPFQSELALSEVCCCIWPEGLALNHESLCLGNSGQVKENT